MRRALVPLAGVLCAVLTACGSTRTPQAPDWQPSPAGQPVEGSPGARLEPILPLPTGGANRSSTSAPNPSASPSKSGRSGKPTKQDPLVVATKLASPVGIAVLPDRTALVGERTTGRIVRVQPVAGQPVTTVRTLPGVDGSGDGGLLDLILSPTYSEDSLIYAYVTTRTDNRVVAFTLTGDITPVFTGIPKGRTGNVGRLRWQPDGSLLVGTGDTGRPALAQDPRSLAGKVLRLTDIGRPDPRNPNHTAVFTTGHHVVDGLCRVSGSATVLEVETGAPGNPDKVNVLAVGDDYGWPSPSGIQHDPLVTMPPAYRGPGDCAVANNRLWIASRDGRALVSAPITGAGPTLGVGKFSPSLLKRYGRLRTVVAAPDGALWLTTTNRDGRGKPVADDERVIRYVPQSDSGGGQRKG